MTSKELNEILNKTRRTPNISLTPEQVEELIKDLERLEKQDKILEILKNIIVVVPNTRDTAGPKYYIGIRQDVILNDEAKKIIKEWLENANHF